MLWEVPRNNRGNGWAEASVNEEELMTGRHTFFENTMQNLILGRKSSMGR